MYADQQIRPPQTLGSLKDARLRVARRGCSRGDGGAGSGSSCGVLDRDWKDHLIFRNGFSSFKHFRASQGRTLSPPQTRSRVQRPEKHDAVPPGYTLPSAFDIPRYTHKPIPSFAGGSALGARESWLNPDTRTAYLARTGGKISADKLAALTTTERSKVVRSTINDKCALRLDEF